jgi:hypothetical protein
MIFMLGWSILDYFLVEFFKIYLKKNKGKNNILRFIKKIKYLYFINHYFSFVIRVRFFIK